MVAGSTRVWIAGVGWSGFHPASVHAGFRDLMWQSSQRALVDAGVEDPRSHLDAVVVCQEDYWEGVSISDEFAPDPTGGVMKPVFTVAGEGLQCVVQAFMLLKAGLFENILVESHGKPSDIADMRVVEKYLMDPHLHRPVGLTPLIIAGMDAHAFLSRWNLTKEDVAAAVELQLKKGYRSPRLCRDSFPSKNEILLTRRVAGPLHEGMLAPLCDGSVSILLTSNPRVASSSQGGAVEVLSVGWETEASIPLLDLHLWGGAPHAGGAWKRARSRVDRVKLDFGEAVLGLDDRYGYNLLVNLVEVGVANAGETIDLIKGTGGPQVNPLGGLLSNGAPLEASGLELLAEVVEALRGEKGRWGMALAWRSFPSLSSTAVLLGGDGSG